METVTGLFNLVCPNPVLSVESCGELDRRGECRGSGLGLGPRLRLGLRIIQKGVRGYANVLDENDFPCLIIHV